jgi:hypothetical protein
MTERSAAQSIYPHLPHDAGQPVQRQQPRLADAMFPSLAPKPPPPAPAPHREPEVSLAQRCDENPWLEYGLALCGIRRVR